MNEIDFVILWVDGSDEKWLKEKNYYKYGENADISNLDNRFRDWNLLRYWFRGVEKNANWVRKIHFVTYGHLPEWLDISNPKINIVNHKDFIPKEYLPTFNSNVIQYYLDRIPGISNQFVMFDDDQFILKRVESTDFFIDGKVCEEYSESPIFPSISLDVYPHCLLNNMQCINKYYKKREVYKKNFFKYFNYKYGLVNNIKSLCLLPWSYFVGFYNPHICQAYTKGYYKLFWKYCEEEIKINSNNRFRKTTDLSTFLIRYLELVDGNFIPRTNKFGKRVELGTNNLYIYKILREKKYAVLCINDSNINIDFESTQKKLISIFEEIYPEKSSFER